MVLPSWSTGVLMCMVTAVLCPSCASIVSSARYAVPIRSEPTGAHFVIKDRNGLIVREGTTPAIVELRASNGYFKRAIYSVELSMPERVPAVTGLRASVNGWYWGNLVFGAFAVVGMVGVDPATGAMYRLHGRMVHEGLPYAY